MQATPHAGPSGFSWFLLVTSMLAGAASAASLGAPPPSEDPAVEVLRQPGPTAGRGWTGIEWVRVHPPGESPCPPYTGASEPGYESESHSIEHVWCFEGAGGDSSWPVRPGQHWDHWSKFDPPGGNPSRWHVSSRHGGAATGAYNAWVGCDSVGTIDACDDVAFWVFQEGYGDDWNYALVLDCSGQSAASGGTIEFDLRYDVEELYDYVYLEYLRNANATWQVVVDSTGAPAVFDGVSGGGGYGNSTWLTNRRFLLPAQSGATKIRWRAESDGAWSDADGSADTDGMGAIDNVTVTFAAGGAVVSDDFETGGFGGVTATIGTAAWSPGGHLGPTWDGWHFEYEPVYPNMGTTCTFDDDWMWSGKEGVVPPEGNGFDFFLVSPAIDVSGWTGGIVQYAEFFNNNYGKRPHSRREVARVYDPAAGWSLWNDFDSFIIPDDPHWSRNEFNMLDEFLGPNVDSLQVAWEFINWAEPGDNSWGNHGGVKYYIDNVSFGSYDATVTVFNARVIDVFSDTFSRVDPAHTPFVQNSDEGDWVGIGGSRMFAPDDSLTVDISDVDGLSAASVELWFRHDDATGPVVAAQTWTGWVGKAMDLSIPDNFNPGWGIYRMTFGDDSAIGFDQGGEDGTGAADGFLWNAGTTVQYYVKVVDDASHESVWPATAADAFPTYFEWSVLPFRVNTAGSKSAFDGVGGETHILLVGDYQRALLDFENSSGFQAAGGFGGGDFAEPAYATPERLVERALALLYGGSADPVTYDPRWDRYDVQGAGSSVQREPRGTSSGAAIGGYGDDDGDPLYDAILWLNGRFDAYSLADTTRLELASTLDRGGRLLSSGDDVVFELDANGNNADSTIGFVVDYLGCDLPSSAYDETIDRTLSAVGFSSGSLDGITLGIYGECPIFRSFDRMALASPTGATNTVLMTYEGGDAADNGTAAVIQCVRDAGGGVAVHSAFDLSALLSDGARACFLDAVLTSSFGLPATAWGGCTSSGVGAPILAPPGWAISKAAPNPFRAATSIELRLPVRSRVSIDVYDVLGRKVRTLADETLPAGSWERTWDGRADDGERAGPGIYFLRVEAGELRATQKAVVLR